MTEISIVIPVLNRPHRVGPLCSNIFENTQVEVEVLFVCSPNDDAEIEAVIECGENFMLVDWEPGHGDFARKHNAAFRETNANYVFLGADDLEFCPDWDLRALEVARRSNAGVIGTNDRANPLVIRGKHATHPLVARRYIDDVGGTWHDGPGIVYSEAYHHQYVDTELVRVAIERGEWAFAHGSVVIHHHPLFPQRFQERTPMDATYEKALGDAKLDQAIFLERQQRAKVMRVVGQ
jgi:glycosyl transferase family 2